MQGSSSKDTSEAPADFRLTSALSNWFLILLVPLYFLSIFLATFFNVAFYREVIHALNGRPVSLSGGLKFAFSKLKQILSWSIFSASVGCILKALEENLGIIGRWVIRLIGMSWSIASTFVVPVIIKENNEKNPLTYLRRSVGVIRQTWGEALIGFVGMRGVPILIVAFFGFLWLLSLVVIFFTMKDGPMFAIAMAGGFILWLLCSVIFSYLCTVMEKIYIGSLYLYASEGVIPENFDQDILDSAWKVKTKKT